MAIRNPHPSRLGVAAGALLAGLCLLVAGACAAQRSTPPAREIPIDGAIGPAVASYVVDELEAAARAGAPLVILRIDTPGGLSSAMRDIVKAILASPVPVVGYVAPSGARAASAGTYILYATNIAAMAPATNLGAATPVNIGPGADNDHGGQGDKNKSRKATEEDNASTERRKMVNDAVAYIRSLAEQRGRNAEWAEQAVRSAASLSAQQALAKHVIDYVAPDATALLAAIDGVRVTTATGPVTLHTHDLSIEQRIPGWRTQLLSIITDPTVAYLLFMVGIFGLVLEGLNPGATLPGVVGGISLFCALFAFQVLPVNYAGLALILLGVALMIAEGFAPSFGALGLGGIAAFVFGSIMLMNTHAPGFQVSLAVIGGIAVAAALLLLMIVLMFIRARRQHVQTGHEGLIGNECVALEEFSHEGRVRLHGESWLAVSNTPVKRGDVLIVTATQGLKVFVRASSPASDASSSNDSPLGGS